MNPIKRKYIFVGLVVAFILFLIYGNENGDYSYEYSAAQTSIPSQSSNRSFNSDRIYTSQPSGSQFQSSLNRQEVLRTNVKGYREATYWGSEHPIDEKIRHLKDDEFNRFIKEEIVEQDNDVYWGAEY